MSDIEQLDESYDSAIAIIGMALRFPGASSASAYWRNLRSGVESVTDLSDEELLRTGIAAETLGDERYVKAAPVLEAVEEFDAQLFGMSPREAALTDPQQRLFLECAWEGLEAAGYGGGARGSAAGAVGVFAGAGLNRYLVENLLPERQRLEEPGGMQVMLGNERDFLATKVSYKLDLRGPAISVSTACSTSLVAVHLACQSLLSGECRMALAGGVSVRVPHRVGYWYLPGGPLSPDGHCRAFDRRAAGTLFGSGAGVVVLKPLAQAISDGDHIHALIRSSAINNDGSRKVGYAAPSVSGQAAVIAEALALAALRPHDISYIEAHGTGTELGDPVEVAALREVFSDGSGHDASGSNGSDNNVSGSKGREWRCALGSVKANFGHLDTAAGVAGLIKTVLMLQHKEIVPQINYEEAGAELKLEGSGFYVNRELREWEAVEGEARRAGVSSFGIGGTNAHVVVEEWREEREEAKEGEEAKEEERGRGWELLVVSARTQGGLEEASRRLREHLEEGEGRGQEIGDVGYTLGVGRREMEWRRVVVCRDAADAAAALQGQHPRRVFSAFQEGTERPVIFMFPGGGSQYVNMGRDLYDREPFFRRQVDACAAILRTQHDHDLLEFLYPRPEIDEEEAARKLKQTPYALPALFVVEYALARLWMEWGVRPQAMIGHSLGEYVAACLSGVLSLEDALALVVHRARLLKQLPPGAMLSIPLPEQELRTQINGKLSVAAVNGPSQCVFSGSVAAIEELSEWLAQREVEFRRLHIDAPGHSEMVSPILEPFNRFASGMRLRSPDIPFISNVSGTWFSEEDAKNPGYWGTHLRQTVRFHSGMSELMKEPGGIYLEVGPGQTLSSLAKLQTGAQQAAAVLTSVRHPQEQRHDVEFLMTTLGKLWLQGVKLNWDALHASRAARRVPLPTYPFEKQRYWIDPSTRTEESRQAGDAMRKKGRVSDWFYVPSWKQTPWHAAVGTRSLFKRTENWLVFLDRCGIGAELVAHLRGHSQRVFTVIEGERFEAVGEDSYRVRPASREDYEALLGELRRQESLPRNLVHLWSLTPRGEIQSGIEGFEQAQETSFYSLLYLAKAAGNLALENEMRWNVVSNGVQVVTGEEELSPEKATVLGLCKVIPQEYVNITLKSIDLVLPPHGSSSAGKLIEYLTAELIADSPDVAIAYRGAYRWAQEFAPVRLSAPEDETSRLREGGVYLITGGAGDVGLIMSQYLAREFRARLVLVGRTVLPEREQWEHRLETEEGDSRAAHVMRHLLQLERDGAEVMFITADVTNESEMRQAVKMTRQRFGALDGVVHAAGAKVANTIQEIEREECERQFSPKVRGLYVLGRVLEGEELDFCMVASSLSSVLGVMGLAAYPSSHIFMDLFVHNQHRQGATQWVSVNWDNWSAALGTGKTTEESSLFMSPAEGAEALRRVLSLGETPQLLVSTADLPARVEKWVRREFLSRRETSPTEEAATLHQRPALSSSYVAPRNELESRLASIWQQTLGIAQVGIEDNYFDLGGDSVLAIHIVARARQCGIRLTPKQLFLHQTVSELAMVAESVSGAPAARQDEVTGTVMLTPVQRWFFEQNFYAPHHWNLSLMLEVRQNLDPRSLEEILKALMTHHDALRLRYLLREEEWTQTNDASGAAAPLHVINLTALSPAQQKAALTKTSDELQTSLSLQEGPLVRVAYFQLDAGGEGKLLIVIHHLASDAVSLRILLEDLQNAYAQRARGESIILPPKTTSFQHWARALNEHAHTEALQKELDYWLSLPWQGASPLQVDHERGSNVLAASRTLPAALDVEETRSLLQALPQSLHVQINDLLLTALGHALWRWTNSPSVLVDLEGHGREEIIEGVDLSRTVGWFTTIFPVFLRRKGEGRLGEQALAMQEELRRVPERGISYGLLRYLAPDTPAVNKLRELPQAQISFLYLGQFDQVLSETSPFALAAEMPGSTRHRAGHRPYLIEVTSIVTGGRLHVNWTYSENLHRRDTIERLSLWFMEALRELIREQQQPPVAPSVPTPADFPAAKLSQKDLDKIMARIKQV